ncbi:MAG: helix-turn-helix domain-containing protein [Chloroflexi bacterium]|nr:helix-turn-helix domain-containing protein [Chloroflexota bacterium]
MTTLAELAAALLPGARPVVARDAEAIDAVVTWVRVMRPRVPAFESLETGDLVIVPAASLAVIAPGSDDRRQLATACRDAGVAGLLLVGREDRAVPAGADSTVDADDRAFTDLAAALAEAGLSALRVDRADVADLERAVIGYLVTGGAELERQAAALEGRLERLALEGGGPAALVAAVASFFGRAVALEGRRATPLAVHAPAESPESMLAATRYQARPRSAVALRVPLPAAGTGPSGTASASGALVLLGTEPPSDLERVAVGRIAGLLALELSRDEAVRRARDATRRAEALPAAGPPWVMFLARQRLPGDAADAVEAIERREANRRELRLLAPARRLSLRGDADSIEIRAVLAVDPPGGSDPLGLATAARVAAFLGRVVAVSLPFSAVADRPAAEAEARAALEAREALPDGGPVAQAALLPIYRILGALHHLGDGDRLARLLLGPLLAGRADVRRARLATLRAVLDHEGLGEAATSLAVHRNTIAYRLRRIETISGWNLADPDVRLAVSIALRIVQDT